MSDVSISYSFNATLSGTSGPIPVGAGLCHDPTFSYWVVATAAALAASGEPCAAGVAVSSAGAGAGTVTVQFTGFVPQSVTGLAKQASETYAETDPTTGLVVRNTATSSRTIGRVGVDGSLRLLPGLSGISLPSASGNGLILASSAGGATRNFRKADFYNALDYGVVGDGVTDDTAAIQALINLVNAAGGGTIWLPGLTYLISATLLLLLNVNIRGSGKNSTKINYSGRGDALAYYGPFRGSTAVHGSVSDLWVNASGPTGSNAGAGLVNQGGTYLDFTNVKTTNFAMGCILDQAEVCTIEKCDFEAGLSPGFISTNFTQPAIGATVAASVVNSSWASVGQRIWVPVGGMYQITAIPDSTHITLMNLGTVGVNAAAATNIPSASLKTGIVGEWLVNGNDRMPYWQPNTAYATGAVVKAFATPGGACYQLQAGGTSGGSEPVWNTTLGSNNSDNGLTWVTSLAGGFTNNVTLIRPQHNGYVVGVVDDGGTAHRFDQMNMNSTLALMMQINGTASSTLILGEWEGSGDGLHLNANGFFSGYGVGQASGLTLVSPFFTPSSPYKAITFYSAGQVIMLGVGAGVNATPFVAAVNVNCIIDAGCFNTYTGLPNFSSYATTHISLSRDGLYLGAPSLHRAKASNAILTPDSTAINYDVVTSGNAAIEITGLVGGATSPFTIGGIAGGVDGQELELLNMTGQQMTIKHQAAGEATAANRIITLTALDIVLPVRNSYARLRYSGTSSRWILVETN